MHRLIASFILAFGFIISPYALSNSIKCKDDNKILSDCRVKTGQIYDKQAHLSDFQVKYSMSCDRNGPTPEHSKIYLSLESGKKLYLAFGAKNQTIDLGQGFCPRVFG